MASQQMICAASSSSSSLVSLKEYDVFLSFRGEDTRRNFTSHLYDALNRKKVITFIDDNELQKGDSISPRLTKAIEESYISIVIFSKDYASSKWCLNELIKILQCKNGWGQVVIPVFYDIDPSHVRKHSGSYQQAFAKHEQDMELNKDMLQKWKDALYEAANLVGFDSSKYGKESDVIKDIVEDVFQKLKHRYPYEVKGNGLVRIEEKCEEIESLLKIRSNDVRTLGLWGMGGIGKTTLAKALCAKLSSQFDSYCFLENVREESKKHGLTVLRHRLFSSLLEEENLRLDASFVETNSILRRLLGKKVLIVLDDMAASKQIECLMIDNNCLGPGSRVIVTTRDKHIIRHAHAIYKVKELDGCDSLELFSLNAFKEKHPKIGYEELSKRAIDYCKGNPLALKVLGARLGQRSELEWESDLKKLQKVSDVEIHDVLKLSFDDLDHTQKDIFLDIACFFNGECCDRVTSLLEDCGFFAIVGMKNLQDKALISVFKKIQMHDLIQDMGRKVVNEESVKNPGKRSRLWKVEEVVDVLKNNKGTKVVERIKLDIYDIGDDLFLRGDSFKMMTSLRYLEICSGCDTVCNIYFPNGLEWLSDELRYLRWDYFSLASLPSNFSAETLVELWMSHGKLKKLWDGVQNVVNLKIINLSFSKDLIEMPNLSKATNLEILSFDYCESLQDLHLSILPLPKLEQLDLPYCKKIESLKSNTHSRSLCQLNLTGCSSLKEFSVTSEKMTRLSLRGTSIRELPSSIWLNYNLEDFDLRGCDKLNIIGNMLSNDPIGIVGCLIRVLNLSGCTEINALNLSFLLDGIHSSLEKLYLNGCCNLETLPHNIKKHSKLRVLELDNCSKLVSFSLTELLPPSLQHLRAVNCTLKETDSTQQLLVENTLRSLYKEPFAYSQRDADILLMPGDQVVDTFDFQKREASITIPPISILNLRGFIFCIILSQGVNVDYNCTVGCRIYEHGKEISKAYIKDKYYVGTLVSDHVLLCWSSYNIGKTGANHDNLLFEFELYHDTEKRTAEGIKGCGILPVYGGLKLDDKSSSSRRRRVEAVELESAAQICDVDEFRAITIGDDDDDGDDQQKKRRRT